MTQAAAGVTLAFLFVDVEGSTALVERDPAAGRAALIAFHGVMAGAVEAHAGRVFETVGDAVYAVFDTPSAAIGAALDAQLGLAAAAWPDGVAPLRARMAVHAGEVERRGSHFHGAPLFRCARLMALGHGGQVLVSGVAASMAGRSLPPGATLDDLGEHRLKDLAGPERILLLRHPDLATDPRPLRTAEGRSVAVERALPPGPTPFLGRSAEVDRLAIDLATPGTRLVTLVGPGGVGKTRLATEAARAAADAFPDGVALVPLAPLVEGDLVIPAVGAALGVADPLRVLAGRAMLLLLDNCEHLAAAPDAVAAILAAAPRVTLLATSRAPLRLAAEQVRTVEPLPIDEAALLLRARVVASGAATPGDDADLRRLAERLDRLPLALELAGARGRLLTPAAMLRRLEAQQPVLAEGPRDGPARQRTLEATVRWSFDLLPAAARDAFAGLAVFRGAFDADAAAEVAGADLDVLADLVDQSLVRQEADRFSLLDTMRTFGEAELRAAGRMEAQRDRHAAWVRAWTQRAHLTTFGADAATARVAADAYREGASDIDAALTWLLSEQRDVDGAYAICNALWVHWLSDGRLREGERWLGRLVEALPPGDRRRRAYAVGMLGEFPRFGGDLTRALPWKAEALALARELGDPEDIATTLYDLGSVLVHLDRFDEARPLFQEGLRLREAAGDPGGLAHIRSGLAELAVFSGDPEAAVRWLDLAIAAATEAGDDASRIWLASSRAEAIRRAGRVADAAAALDGALRDLATLGRWLIVLDSLETGAALALDVGRAEEAARLLGFTSRVREETGLAPDDPRAVAVTRERARHALGAATDPAVEAGRTLDRDAALALCLQSIAPLPPVETGDAPPGLRILPGGRAAGSIVRLDPAEAGA